MDQLTVACNDDGTYDIAAKDYTCTSICLPPSNPDPDRIEHSWPNMSINLEIGEEVIHKCKDVDGIPRKLVSRGVFESGEATDDQFIDQIMSSCQVDGALNETIGSYTCTRPCEPPLNYSEVFTFDWDESIGTEIGTQVKYVLWLMITLGKILSLKLCICVS